MNIRKLISDDDKLIELIKKQPQTYYTILGKEKDNGTLNIILRRRIKRIVEEGFVWKIRVPRTRFGLVLLSYPEMKYKILIKQNIGNVQVFYTYKIKKLKKYIEIYDYYELLNNWKKWIKQKEKLVLNKVLFEKGEVLIYE
jgi:hypothetical protein